ncbi:C-type lectin 37Db-like [Drosophila bipectinata]|uniref:C-type lectin 37Db-like n=1 Tax=Drosophila bipectinata TaxID=42026 RepID=UPI001C895462|nr:C-type lectin domain family 4 member G-like [Drosophila bipectinata]
MVRSVLFACCFLALGWGLAARRCPPNFNLVGHKCLYISPEKADWFTADRFCGSLGAEIYVADDSDDKMLLTEYLSTHDLIAERYWDSMWAGINCLGNNRNFVRARDGSAVFLDWMRAEPNNRGGDEDCVSFVNYEGDWNSGYLDVKCSLDLKYICQIYGKRFIKY